MKKLQEEHFIAIEKLKQLEQENQLLPQTNEEVSKLKEELSQNQTDFKKLAELNQCMTGVMQLANEGLNQIDADRQKLAIENAMLSKDIANYMEPKSQVIKAQAIARGKFARKEFKADVKNIELIQSEVKSLVEQKKFKATQKAAITIQSAVRMFSAQLEPTVTARMDKAFAARDFKFIAVVSPLAAEKKWNEAARKIKELDNPSAKSESTAEKKLVR